MKPTPAKDRARRTLDEALAGDWSWTRVHAAEVLSLFGGRDRVRSLFLSQRGQAENSRFRTGLWRVLAGADTPAEERRAWITRVEGAFLDPAAEDRIAALEGLCKLRYQAAPAAIPVLRRMAEESSDYAAIEPLWALALGGESAALGRLISFLASPDPSVRFGAAFALRWLRPAGPETARALVRAIAAEEAGTTAYPFLLSAGLHLGADPAQSGAWRSRLEALGEGLTSDARYEIWQALMTQYTPADIPRAAAGLDHPDPNSRIGAAWAILHILGR